MASLPIYTGFWRNWGASDGSGSLFDFTLTVPRSQGTLIVAFLALFLSASVAHIWPIFCFVIHQSRATSSPRLGLYHQQQAVLSNTLSPSAAAVGFAKLAWTWRLARVKGTTWSSALLVLAATLALVFLAAAGLATSRVQLESDEVLTVSDTCGWPGGPPYSYQYDQPKEFQKGYQIAYAAWARWAATSSLEYVRSCYRQLVEYVRSCYRQLAEPGKCGTFTKPHLILQNRTVGCPFAEEICGLPEAFQVDTGYIDSNKDLGINSNEAERLKIRKIMTCVPIPAEEKYSTSWTSERPGSYYYPGLKGNMYRYYDIGAGIGRNFTWVVNNYSVSSGSLGLQSQIISLGGVYLFRGEEGNVEQGAGEGMEFIPIPALAVADADINVLFLGNNARYQTAVEDPWFRASNTSDWTGSRRRSNGRFLSDRIMSALACTEQYEFCAGGKCSELAGIRYNDTMPWCGLDLGDHQKAVFNLAYNALFNVALVRGIKWLGPSILRANEFLWYGDGDDISTAVPPNHWKDEVHNFMQVMMAVTQRLMVEFATKTEILIQSEDGPVSSKNFLVPPLTQAERDMCGRMRIRDARFANFSVVGLVVTLAAGVAVTLVNLCLLPGTGFWLQRRLRLSSYGEREWRSGQLFMQQKVALEGKGVGPWQVDEGTGVPWMVPESEEDDAGLLDESRREGRDGVALDFVR